MNEYNSANVSDWILEDGEEPAFNASLLEISDDSGSVATDKWENISVGINRTEATRRSEGSRS